MDAGETMVEVMRPTTTATTTTTANASGDTHEGIKQYYVQKIEELQVSRIETGRMNNRWVYLAQCGGEKPEFTSAASET